MRTLCGGEFQTARRGERGGSRFNFLIVALVICALAYTGYQVVPVLFRAQTFETFMQDTVNNAAVANKNPAWVEQQLRNSFGDYDVPPGAIVRCVVHDGRYEVQVQYARTIPLIVKQYDYQFDKTVRSSTVGGS